MCSSDPKDEIMQVDKIALMDDIVLRRTLRGALNDGSTAITNYKWVKIAEVTVPCPVDGVQCYVAGSFIVMASGSKGCAKREVHFNFVGLANAGGSVTIRGYSVDSSNAGRSTAAQNQKACGIVMAVPTNNSSNPPSLTTAAYYDIWMKVYNLDFFSIYPSSFTEGQGTIKWKEATFDLAKINDTNWVRDQTPTGTNIVTD